MLFNSPKFIFIFLPLTLFLYFYLNSKEKVVLAKLLLVLASLCFYSWWHIIYLPLIVLSIIFNFSIGKCLTDRQTDRQTTLLTLGIGINLLLLGYFKYTDFFLENINLIFNSQISLLNLTLPLAISFFTFQQIAYLVDSYRGETNNSNLLDYCLFVTFFPQLIAGPIVHHREMIPQFNSTQNKHLCYDNIALGIAIFSIGLFKKNVIADNFANWANKGFNSVTTLNFFEGWTTSLSYTFQLYFDFSGYTDMAIGVALLFNIKLPTNFNSPYKALNIQDFWQRWHITLSRFLKQYIYIPLGGNRAGNYRTYNNLMITFLIGGLWHGAGWTFICWGTLHGLALITHRLWQRIGIKLHHLIAWLITFNFINLTWVFFRADDWGQAVKVISAMLAFSEPAISPQLADMLNFINPLNSYFTIKGGELTTFITPVMIEGIIAALILIQANDNSNSILQQKHIIPSYRACFFIVILLIFSLFGTNTQSEFLYFNF